MQALQSYSTWTQSLLPHCLPCKFTCLHALIGRITANWKEMFIDCSAIVATCGLAITFFTGPIILSIAFFLMTVGLYLAAYQMRRFSTLSNLENTAKDLQKTKEKMENIALNLKKENDRLAETNRNLSQNNLLFQQNNARLIQTNNQLQLQVTQLTLQVTQLRESAEKIRSEVVRFQQENSHLNTNVRGFNESLRVLDQQLLNSRALCEQITNHLTNQQQGLGEQLTQLSTYLHELRADNRVHEKIQELNALQQQMTRSTHELHQVQLQYTTERAKFQTVHEALALLKNQFDLAIREAANNLRSNNVQFKDNVTALSQERQKLQDLINRHFG